MLEMDTDHVRNNNKNIIARLVIRSLSRHHLTLTTNVLQGELEQQELPLGEGEDKNLVESVSESRSVSRLGTPKAPPAINPTLAALLQQDEHQQTPLGVEEVSQHHCFSLY